MKQFLELIENKPVVTFDIFDTLLHRKLAAPTDLFELIRAYFLDKDQMLHNHDLIINFPHLRRLSEDRAREHRVKEYGGEAEIVFDEIYEQFQEISHCDDLIIEDLKKAELFLESEVLYQSKRGYTLYSEAKKQNKTIYYISDMYLPTYFLKYVLEKNGYTVESEKQIFVSGEQRITKHSSKLFEYFLTTENINASECLHVGDNKHADIVQANTVKIGAYHANWAEINNTYKSLRGHFNDYIARSVCMQVTLPQHNDFLPVDPYEKLGYQIWGPLLFGHMIWLTNELRSEKIDTALFFARDAHFILSLFKNFFQHLMPELHTEYISVSRASLLPLSFTDWSMDRIWKLFDGKVKKTVKDIFDLLQLNAYMYIDDIRQVGFSTVHDVITEDKYHSMHHLVNKMFQPIMIQSKKLRETYGEYLQNYIKNASKIALIDIGWSGNMQAMFLRSLDEDWVDKEFIGLYFGTTKKAEENISPYVNFRAWLTSNGIPEDLNDMLTKNGGLELMEFALTAQHGTTLRFNRENGAIIPVKDNSETHIDYGIKAEKIQNGVKQFFKTYQFLIEHFSLDSLQSKAWSNPFVALVNEPSKEYIELLASLTHSDTAGDDRTRIPLAIEVSEEAKQTQNEEYQKAYDQSYWKSAFIKLNEI